MKEFSMTNESCKPRKTLCHSDFPLSLPLQLVLLLISNLLHNGTKTFLKPLKIESYSYYKVHIAFLKIFPFLYLNNNYVVFWISMLIITYSSSLVRLWNFNAVHAESKVETAKGNICNFKSWIFNFSADTVIMLFF